MTDRHRRGLVSIKVNGTPLPEAALGALREVRVEQSLNVPDAFTLRFSDPGGTVLDDPSFGLGARVEIGVDTGGVVARLMTGEITGLAAEMESFEAQHLVVTGLDRRHRMARGVKVETYLKVTDTDVVEKIANRNGLRVQAGASGAVYDYLLQTTSDYEFVGQRARACGFEWWVDGDVLHFESPRGPGTPVAVIWGETLRRFRLRLSSAESATATEVRGWDPVRQEGVCVTSPMGDANGVTTTAPLATRRAKTAAGKFPTKRLAWGAPVQSIREAKGLAAAMAARMGSEQAVAKGEALGDAAIRPGVALRVSGLAPSLCGDYRLSRVEHVLRAGEAYLTRFESGGAADHTLVDLLGGGDRSPAPGRAAPPLGSSLVVGVVSNKNDPDKRGRVKVRLLGVDHNIESAWARVVSVGAGKSRGLQMVPDVGDEVLVGFEYGDLRRPFVIGGLWSGRNANPRHATAAGTDGAVWETKSGHLLSMSDGAGAESYTRLALAGGNTALRLGADQSSLETERDLAITGAAAIAVKGRTNVTVEGINITIKAGAKLVLEGGAGVEIKSNGLVTVDGAVVDVKAKAKASLQGGGIAQISGGVVKIN